MLHRPIVLKEIALSFPEKTCFENFSTNVHPGDRIAIIGKNGSGKSHLLRMLCGEFMPQKGELYLPSEVVTGYVPQIVDAFNNLSGAQRLNKSLSEALSRSPNLLCLDEPTNHLDERNRRSLFRMLENYRGTLVVVSHDMALLELCFEKLWYLAEGRVHVESGSYSDFISRTLSRRRALENTIDALSLEKQRAHIDLMRDQQRAKKRRIQGEKKYDGDKLALRSAQGRGQLTTNKNRKRIATEKDSVTRELEALRLPEVLKPKFSLSAERLRSLVPIISIRDGKCGYLTPVLEGLNLQIKSQERVWIAGRNGCGKSTLVRAILSDPLVSREGDWRSPAPKEIGYLDQHYMTVRPELSPLQTIQACAPHWQLAQVRDHLNAFLFRKNNEVNLPGKYLSGGEKARLSLAQIAAITPRLLILDEITNNLDLDTRKHVIEVLREYPGAMIVISHDEAFIREVGIQTCYRIRASTDKTERAEPFTNFLPQVVEVVLDVTRP